LKKGRKNSSRNLQQKKKMLSPSALVPNPAFSEQSFSVESLIASQLPGESLNRVSQFQVPPLNCSARIKVGVQILAPEDQFPNFHRIPVSFDWRNPADVTRIHGVPDFDSSALILGPQNQYACGSCWAFGVANALSDRYAIWNHFLKKGQGNPDLSVTFLLACLKTGCGGSFPSDGALFLEQQGAPSSSCVDYSWCTQDATCSASNTGVASVNLSPLIPSCPSLNFRGCHPRWKALKNSTMALVDTRSIRLDVLQFGPVCAVCRIYADFLLGSQQDQFQSTKGIYIHVPGKTIYKHLGLAKSPFGTLVPPESLFCGNHCMVIVGFGRESKVLVGSETLDVDYWVVRNSWGTSWNQSGYVKIAFTDPDTGVNTELGFDVPLRVQNANFGGATSCLPDLQGLPKPKVQTLASPVISALVLPEQKEKPEKPETRSFWTVGLLVLLGLGLVFWVFREYFIHVLQVGSGLRLK
jgi:hypothetical protein